jgi:hypothetical protein
MPAHGYQATARLTDSCGAPIPGASLVVAHRTATPTFPATFKGTAYVVWTIKHADPKGVQATANLNLSLAAKEVIGGKAVACPVTNPYTKAPAASAHHVAVAPATPGLSGATIGGLGACLLVVVVCGVLLLRRLQRHRAGRDVGYRGAHR